MEKTTLIAICASAALGASVVLGISVMVYNDSNNSNKAIIEMVKAGADPIAAHCAIYGSVTVNNAIKPECVASVLSHQEVSK